METICYNGNYIDKSKFSIPIENKRIKITLNLKITLIKDLHLFMTKNYLKVNLLIKN